MHYLCIDAFSMPALLEQIQAYGIKTPDNAISFFTTLNSALEIL